MICLGNRLIWSHDTDLSLPLYLLLPLGAARCELRARCRAERGERGALALFMSQAEGEDLCNRRPQAISISF